MGKLAQPVSDKCSIAARAPDLSANAVPIRQVPDGSSRRLLYALAQFAETYSKELNMEPKSIGRVGAAALMLAVMAAEPSRADDPLPLNPGGPWYGLNFESGWDFDVGIGFEYEPAYAGSDEYSSEPDVTARALYRTENGHRYVVSLGEIGVIYSLSPDWQFLAFLEYEEGRDDEDDATLTGMDDIDSTIEGQFTLARRFNNVTLYGALQPDLLGDADKGLVWFVGAGYDWLSEDRRWRANTTVDISGADGEYMRTEFGVTPEESVRTGYSSFRPGSGLKSLTWNVGAERYFSDRFSVLFSVDTELYLDDAADSPLVAAEGTDVTYEASVLLRYRF